MLPFRQGLLRFVPHMTLLKMAAEGIPAERKGLLWMLLSGAEYTRLSSVVSGMT